MAHSYDYSNLTIDIPNTVKRDNPYKLGFKIYGFTSLGVMVLILAPLSSSMVIVGGFNFIRKKILQGRNKSTTEHHSVQMLSR
jgi:hypothetical protein